MEHRTHKRFIREIPMDLALQIADRMVKANIDFVLETKPATRSRVAYISCHFEETLDTVIKQLNGDRLSVALDTETSPMKACAMPQGHPTHCGCLTHRLGENAWIKYCVCPPGTDRTITQGGHFPACTACGRRLKLADER